MIRAILRFFGYYKVDYGHATGRHWMSIDGRMIAQSDDDIWLRDEDVHRIVFHALDHGEHWSAPRQIPTLSNVVVLPKRAP